MLREHPVVENLVRFGQPSSKRPYVTCPRCGAEISEGEHLYYDTSDRIHGAQLVCGECLREKYESLDTHTFLLCVDAEFVTVGEEI